MQTLLKWTPGRDLNPRVPRLQLGASPCSATRRGGVGDGNRTRKNQSEGLGASQFACTDEELRRATLSEEKEWSGLRESNPSLPAWKAVTRRRVDRFEHGHDYNLVLLRHGDGPVA